MSEQKCDNCRFWFPNTPQAQDKATWGDLSDEDTSQCRRFPPMRLVAEWKDGIEGAISFAEKEYNWFWPATSWDEWCGEWQASGSKIEVNMTLEEAGASGRLLKSTRKMGIRTVEQLSRIQRYDLYCQRHVGEHTLAEAESILERFGLKFLPPS